MTTAKFTIDTSAFSDRGFDGTLGQVLDLQLEDQPALDVWKTVFEVVQKSEGAPDIAELGAIGGGGASPATPQGILQITLPAVGMHFYIIRCTINAGAILGVTQEDYAKERAIAIRVSGQRKIAPAEATQYDETFGWSSAHNELAEAFSLSGAAGAWREPAKVANVAALPAYTRSGNVLTASANGSINSVGIDGYTSLQVGDRVLYWTGLGTSHADYGIYGITALGDGSNPWVFTRVPTLDESAEVTKALTVAIEGDGATKGGHAFRLVTTGTITINTTALEFDDVGHLGALVTVTDPGVVAALGAANTVFQSDGSTAGGVWRASLNLGSSPGAGHAINLTKGDALGFGSLLALSMDTGDNIFVGGVTTDSLYLGAGLTEKIYCQVNAATVLTIEGALITAAQPVALAAAAYLRMGLVAGSGAGSAASAGTVRLQDDGQIVFRNAADGGDVAGISCNGGDNVYVGGAYPTRPGNLYLDATSAVYIHAGGSSSFYVTNSNINFNETVVRFLTAMVAPSISHQADAAAGATGDDFSLIAQDVSDPAGGATSGDFGIRGGQGLVHANNLDGNVWFHVAPANWQTMEKGIFIADVVTAPGGNPAAGGFLFSSGGGGFWKGSGGTLTNFGPAAPRCSACGHDFWKQCCCSPRFDSYLLECGMCGKVYKKGPASIIDQLESGELDELIYDDDDQADPRPEHKKRTVIESLAGLAYRNKSAGPTLQEYRRQCTAAIEETDAVLRDGDADQVATRAIASAAVADIRAAWVEPWQSWRDLYGSREDGAALVAQLDSDVVAVDAETDGAVAAKEWEAPPEPEPKQAEAGPEPA